MTVRILKLTGIAAWSIALCFAIWLMVRLSLPYTAMHNNIDFLLTKQNVYHITPWRYCFYAHVFTSVLVLPAGLTQFNHLWLQQFTKAHRLLGYVYVITVIFVAAPTGFVMGWYANGGWPARASFILLSMAWFTSTLLAVIMVKRKNFVQHGIWMLRSYALTLSAIMLRTYAFLFDVLHIDMHPRTVYITIAWLSWVPNIIIAEILIRHRFVTGFIPQSKIGII